MRDININFLGVDCIVEIDIHGQRRLETATEPAEYPEVEICSIQVAGTGEFLDVLDYLDDSGKTLLNDEVKSYLDAWGWE